MDNNPLRTGDPFFDLVGHGLVVDQFDDDRFKSAIDNAIKEGSDGFELYEIIKTEQVRQIRDDPSFRDELKERFRESKVNLPTASLTRKLPGRQGHGPKGTRLDLAAWQARIDHMDWFHKALSPTQARNIIDQGDVGLIINTQNLSRAIDGNLDEIEVLYNFGVRIAGLTYNDQELMGSGCTERVDGGLSNHGVKAVKKLNQLGIIVSLSHSGKQTTLDAVEVSDAPVMYSHTGCEAISGHDVTKSDEELKALAEVDGFIGIQNSPPFNVPPGREGEEWEVFFEHIDHAIDLVGIDRVGIGSDWGLINSTSMPQELKEGLEQFFRDYAYGYDEKQQLKLGIGFGPMKEHRDSHMIPEELSERGYTDEEVRKICGENFLAYWERVVANS